MERVMQWRVGPTRASRVHRRNTGGRRLRAAAATGAMVAVTMPALSADGAVGGGRSIEVFTGSDLISLTGYPPNTQVKVEVVRQGFVVGFATKRTLFDGSIEMNHVGATAGDCFESPTSPDVQPRDTIRTTIMKPGGATDTSVVRGVWIDDVDFAGTTITVSGRVALNGPAAVNAAADVLELRINKDADWSGIGRSDRREDIGLDVDPNDGTWTHVMTASEADVTDAELTGETFLEWSDGAAATPSELTVAEAGEPEPIEGCPPIATDPTAPLMLRTDDSGQVGDHVTNKATDLTFSGLAGTGVEGDPGPGNTVTLVIDDAEGPQVTADGQGVYRFTGVNLAARATPYTLRVQSQDASTVFTSADRLVRVDTTKPAVQVRSFAPTPLHLSGAQRLRAVYRVGEGATLQARVEHLNPTKTVRTFAQRNKAAAGLAEFTWNGKNGAGRDVQPGRYRLVLKVTDKAGNVALQRNALRVMR